MLDLSHAALGKDGGSAALHDIRHTVELGGLAAQPELVDVHAVAFQIFRHDGVAAAGAGEACDLGEGADLDGALAGAIDLEDAAGQQTGAHGVHPSAGGGAGGADDFARALRRGADVVDGAALEVKGQLFALVQCFQHPLVGLVAGGVHHTGQQHGIARFQGREVCRRAGSCQFVLHLHSPLASWPSHNAALARRVTWQETFTATGRPATWVGICSMARPRQVVLPPKP